jgi:hypothetical protein
MKLILNLSNQTKIRLFYKVRRFVWEMKERHWKVIYYIWHDKENECWYTPGDYSVGLIKQHIRRLKERTKIILCMKNSLDNHLEECALQYLHRDFND